jgi:hypothetical protein
VAKARESRGEGEHATVHEMPEPKKAAKKSPAKKAVVGKKTAAGKKAVAKKAPGGRKPRAS